MMNGLFRNPLATVATVIAVGFGAMTVTAHPAAALTDRQALGLALGIGTAAVVLHQIDKNSGKSHRPRHAPPPPPPRYSQHGPKHAQWNHRPAPHRHDFRGPQHGPQHGPQRGWR
ncbi:hypothetical protein [Paenirhodobacter populi]|uniref:Uncharacterized protein n=1 Tax=Paenirhodobacter populi TaxID=2306993 RepID=A0A443JI19_9RHOB|nr:hypothetical protein [Sinirhodobacter populi]RWR11360.1 hypothetical protein D2T32_00670 [Sinirhodobacter populi]RWR20168.1 hypothetical protein D2T30_12060 [Sinirhodobacter populi]RWR31212.1 hypothetical protein D2T31_05835 [Sinirhodobacter populi]